MFFPYKRRCVSLAILVITVCAQSTQAASVDGVINAESKRIKDGQVSQKKIDGLSDKADNIIRQLRTETKIVDGLKVYNTQLQKQIDGQADAVAKLEQSISQVAIIERQIVPLMIKMIDSLEAFVELDVPFSLVERRQRVVSLKGYMAEANISASERFRKVLEAYEIENEYGRTIEAYSDTLAIGSDNLEVDVLRVGRVGLYYQTKDGKRSGVWDKNQKTWAELASDSNRHIRKAIRVAKKQTAPELLTLPVHAPEGV